jgi:hypothetical protein
MKTSRRNAQRNIRRLKLARATTTSGGFCSDARIAFFLSDPRPLELAPHSGFAGPISRSCRATAKRRAFNVGVEMCTNLRRAARSFVGTSPLVECRVEIDTITGWLYQRLFDIGPLSSPLLVDPAAGVARCALDSSAPPQVVSAVRELREMGRR